MRLALTTATIPAARIEHLLAGLVPPGTGVAACRANGSLLQHLTVPERAIVRSARPVRRSEFAAGRTCAHRALAAIGADIDTITIGPRRQPVWPVGVTGSISHAAGLAAAVAARITPTVAALGIDIELADRLDGRLWAYVLTPSERARCEAAEDSVATATSVFSVKEAAFKALYPLLGIEIEFLEAHTEINAGVGRVEVPNVGASVAVRYSLTGGIVLSVAVVTTAS